MKIKKTQQTKRITNIIHHTEIFTKCLIIIDNKDYPIDITICYEDYLCHEKFVLFLMLEKLNQWDESCKEYMDIKTYVRNCIKKIYPDIDFEKVSKQVMKLIQKILDENQIENLWE